MMNTPIFVPWLLTALLALISIILLAGKASFLIAGYNTASKEQKQRYNEKRLCRVMGGGVGAIAVMLGIATTYHFEMPVAIGWLIPWGLFGAIIVMIVLASTVCRRKP